MPKMLTSAEVLTVFKCSPRTLRRWLASSDFPKPIRTGRSRRWYEKDIVAYLAKRETK